MAAATALADWVASSPLIAGVLFGSSDGETPGPPICAVAVAGCSRGFGKGHTHSQALASAVGEALEQLAASQIDPHCLRYATLTELAGRAFDPAWLGLPIRNQPIHWVAGHWLDTAEPVYLPAFAVYLSNRFSAEARGLATTSNGLGAGSSLESAVEHAVLELFERDAFLLSWYACQGKQPVDKSRIGSESAAIAAHLTQRGGQTDIYLIAGNRTALVAVAVSRGNGISWPAFTLGLGAARDETVAIDKAILELGQTAPFIARRWLRREVPIPARPDEITTLQDHALYYCESSHAAEFNRWLESGSLATAEPASEHRIAIADLTTPEMRDSPFRVVRALSAGLQPLLLNSRYLCPRLRHLLAGRRPNPAPVPIC